MFGMDVLQPLPEPTTTEPPEKIGRAGTLLAGGGALLAVLAALLLWQAEGPAVFLSAALAGLQNCF
jgi:hypothetical protein